MSNTIIKPTVGRVVWFYPSKVTGEAGFASPVEGEPLAAIIAKVWNDKLINLTVFDANGVPHSRTSVALVQDGEPIPTNGYYATWMPYQVGQAKGAALIEATQQPAGIQPTQLAAIALEKLHSARNNLVQTGNYFTTIEQDGNHIVVSAALLNSEFLARGLPGECIASPLQLRTKSA
jgi:hypothetical protein